MVSQPPQKKLVSRKNIWHCSPTLCRPNLFFSLSFFLCGYFFEWMGKYPRCEKRSPGRKTWKKEERRDQNRLYYCRHHSSIVYWSLLHQLIICLQIPQMDRSKRKTCISTQNCSAVLWYSMLTATIPFFPSSKLWWWENVSSLWAASSRGRGLGTTLDSNLTINCTFSFLFRSAFLVERRRSRTWPLS